MSKIIPKKQEKEKKVLTGFEVDILFNVNNGRIKVSFEYNGLVYAGYGHNIIEALKNLFDYFKDNEEVDLGKFLI